MRNSGMFKAVFVIAIIVIVASLVLKGTMIGRALQNGKTLYQIDVNKFNNIETYITTEYLVDPNTKCITFKDEMGLKRTVCNNYTITEY